MSGDKKKLIAFNYFGGKFTFVDSLVPYFPKHTHFVDVFCGSMAVTLNKPYSEIDTVNDINGDVVNFFRVLRSHPEELLMLLNLTPVSREEYDDSWVENPKHLTDIERARRFYVRVRQSYCALGVQKRNKGWHLCKTISRASKADTVSKWLNGIDKLIPVIDRIRNIQIENKDFRLLIPDLDFKDAFFYCDPPYPIESRNSHQKGDDYMFDFTDQDHEDLAEKLNNIEGKAMVSGYECDLMHRLYPKEKGWHFVKFPVKQNNLANTDVRECIWINYEPLKRNQYELFSETKGSNGRDQRDSQKA